MTETNADVVVVGGGIAGGALAVQLARGGLGVVVLEQSVVFTDRVRGETMPPWGYLELVRTDLLDVVMRAEGTVAGRSVPYTDVLPPDVAEAVALDLGGLLPGVPGMLNLSHPAACQALLDAAEALGVRVARGVRHVQVTAGPAPAVTFTDGAGEQQALRSRLVVGADGRGSRVARQVGVEYAGSGARTFGAGVLVEDLAGWPAGTNTLGSWGDVHFLLFPRQDGRARLYLLWDRSEPGRFAGADGGERMLATMAQVQALPHPEVFAGARALPGCASYPMGDTWCDRPYVEGVVLVGDAAGHNDPVIGQGLSIAVRDSRLVAEALLGEGRWRPETFADYATERAERMRRLCATAEAATRLRADFSDEGRRRRAAAFARFASDPQARLPIAASLLGPENLPAEAFTREAADRMLALT